MRNSEQINEIAKALSKAQGEMKPAGKDSVNPHFKSKFSSLESVWDAIRVPLSANEIAVLQDLTSNDKGIAVETKLIHSSGQWMEFGPLFIPSGRMDAQAFGSSSSYAKRYALCAALGIVSGEDDDAEATMNRTIPQKEEKATKQQIEKLTISLKVTDEEIENICKFNNVKDIKDLSILQATKAISAIEKKREKENEVR